MANIDTMNCYISCEACSTSLGNRDAFVSSGQGTALQYDLLLEECMKPCSEISNCQMLYEQLLQDMSPVGQYGEVYDDHYNIDPSIHPLSIYNINNILPKNYHYIYNTNAFVLNAGNGWDSATWRQPIFEINLVWYKFYMDDNGDSSKIQVIEVSPGNYYPQVDFASNVIYNNASGTYYVYPQHLKNVADFINAFNKPSWARSLVYYHPEYSYYQDCRGYGKKTLPSDNFTSDKFDALLSKTMLFYRAMDEHLVKLSYDGLNQYFTDVLDGNSILSKYNDPYDPFVTSGNFFSYGDELKNLVHDYKVVSGTHYSMLQYAAYIVLSTNPYATNFTDFGNLDNIYYSHSQPYVLDDSIRNVQWDVFKNLYLSAKQEIQIKKAKDFASAYGGYNECIGNSNYSPIPSLFNYSNLLYWYNTYGDWKEAIYHEPYFSDNGQPCNCYTRNLYANKKKRFVDKEDLPSKDYNSTVYQQFLQSGQCPNATGLQGLLNVFAYEGKLTYSSNVPLQSYPEFSAFCTALNHGTPTGILPALSWKSLTTNSASNLIDVDIVDASGNGIYKISLDKSGSGIGSWDDVKGIKDIDASQGNGFTFTALVFIPSGVAGSHYVAITGTTVNINVKNCNFKEECKPNDLANDLMILMNTLTAQNTSNLTNVTQIQPNILYSSMVTPVILSMVGESNSTVLRWTYNSTDKTFKIYNTSQNNKLSLKMNSAEPSSFVLTSSNFGQIKYFKNIRSEHQNFFAVDAYDGSGALLATLHGEAYRTLGGYTYAQEMGTCALPTPNSDCLNGISADGIQTFGGGSGLIYTDTTLEIYNKYVLAVHNLNSKMNWVGSYEIIPINYINFQSFYLYAAEVYTRFVQYFDPNIDDVEWLTIPDYFINAYGASVNPWKEYERYSRAVQLYNLRANNTGLWEMMPEDINNFMISLYADHCYLYVDYLRNYPNQYNAPAIDISQYFLGQYPTSDSCQLLYERYIVAHSWFVNWASLHDWPCGTEDQIGMYHSYDKVVGNKLCCDPYGIALFENYINSFYDTTNCPVIALPMLTDCNSNSIVVSDPRDCSQEFFLYQQYINKYNNSYYATELTGYSLIIYEGTFDLFMGLGTCECVEAYLRYLTYYINAGPGSTLPTPLSIFEFGPCKGFEPCKARHDQYTTLISQYNASYYGQHYGQMNFLDYDDFIAYNLCNCFDSYMLYLTEYLTSENHDFPEPLEIFEFGSCEISPIEIDPCFNTYIKYKSAIAEYTQFAQKNPGLNLPSITEIYNKENFVPEGLCYCADSYIAFLHAVINRTITDPGYITAHLDLVNSCHQIPCAGDTAITDTITLPPVSHHNPCVENIIAVAIQNASNEYSKYIDSTTTAIASLYNDHCMHPTEDLFQYYNDKEYHFTLYYYDQAGNLIKTVPPEGVIPLPITASSDALEQKIIQDRTYGKHSVYTTHNLESRNEYNSLNQLVKQTVPDHDKINLFETSLPDGLENRLNIQNVQFVNSNTGYLCGYIAINGLNRGYLYRTDDAGITWHRVDNLVASDLQKVQMVDASTGYAVGTSGIVLKTVDGGNSWDMLDLYSVNNFTGKLNDLYFKSSTDGIIAGDDAALLHTSDGGNTWTKITLNGLPTVGVLDDITSITFDNVNSNLFFSIKKSPTGLPTNGMLYKITSSTGSTWSITAFTNVHSLDLNDLCYYETGKGYAAGVDGTLLWTNDHGNAWYALPTNVKESFKRIYFTTQNDGIALIDSVTDYGKLYKTHDGGLNWERVSTNSKYFTDFYPYYPLETLSNPNHDAKVVLVGPKGSAYRCFMIHGTPFATIDISSANTSQNFKAVWGAYYNVTADPKTKKLCLLASGIDSRIYYSVDGESPSMTWGIAGSSSIGATVKDLIAVILNPSSATPNISGCTIDVNGKLHGFDVSGFNLTSLTSNNFSSPIQANQAFLNFADRLKPSGSNFIAYANNNIPITNNDCKVYEITLTSGYSPLTASAISTTNTYPGSTVNNIYYDGSNLNFVGQQGLVLYHNAGTLASQINNIKPLPLNDIEYNSGSVYGVGINGTLINYDLANSTGQLLPSRIAIDLNSIKFNSATSGLTVGEKGNLYYFTNNGNFAFTKYSVPTSEKLNDIAITGNNGAFVTGDNGVLLYSANLGMINSYSLFAQSGNASLNGISILPGSNSNAFIVGEKNAIQNAYGSVRVLNRNVFAHALNGVHFSDIANGYVAGDGYTLRSTSDGGNSWKIIIDQELASLSSKTLNKVYCGNGRAFVSGNSGYLGRLTPTTSTRIPLTSYKAVASLHELTFTDSLHGFIAAATVIGSTPVACFIFTTDGGTNWDVSSNVKYNSGISWNGIHGFKNSNTCILAGDGNGIGYFDGTNIKTSGFQVPAGVVADFKDIYFHDDARGYVVGTNGTLVLGTATFNSSTFKLSSVTWETSTKPMADGLNSQNTVANVTINSIAFPTRYNGFAGGFYNGSVIDYARLISDESNYYSTFFWYDRLGRLVLSENSKQFKIDPTQRLYSYTLYDELGRIKEVGQKHENSSGLSFNNIFGSNVNGDYNPKVMEDGNIYAWVDGNGSRTEVTQSFYDVQKFSLPATQENLRKRVSSITYSDVYNADSSVYNNATHYSYDIHGNVKTMFQDNPALSSITPSQRFKRVDYDYDLISGKVNKISYQTRQADQFFHRYEYDADNRITHVETSRDGMRWDMDVKYFYYKHGPLARMELGKNLVQGVDYVYTLQGWIKGVNSNSLNANRDPGIDGNISVVSNPNKVFPPDVFGYSLNYFNSPTNGDFVPIDAVNKWATPSNRFTADMSGSQLLNSRYDLYNGNISAMVTSITDPNTGKKMPLGNAYQYDQLNRLIEAKAFDNISFTGSNNAWNTGTTFNGMYENALTYDANGNIMTQVRKNQSGANIDNLAYNYERNSNGEIIANRLYHVDDGVPDATFSDDIDDEGAFQLNSNDLSVVRTQNNYSYDEIGNLTKDTKEGMAEIKWTVAGKIKEIDRTTGSVKKKLVFDYDGSGNRIRKQIINNSTGTLENSTYYMRDAQGNILATYDESYGGTASFKLKEKYIYGSSRIGTDALEVQMIGSIEPGNQNSRVPIGVKRYELTNHLGNVLAVVSDKKYSIDGAYNFVGVGNGNYNFVNGVYSNVGTGIGCYSQTIAPNGTIDSYVADIKTSQDYSPFGVLLADRNFSIENYRFGFNGQEKVDEISGPGNHNTAEFWEYDTRIGRRWNIDPKEDPSISVYACFKNNPLFYTDIDGDTTYQFGNDGKFIGMADKDIAGIRGAIGTMKNVKGADGQITKQFFTNRNFNFNDPGFDRTQLNSLKKNDFAITFLSDENMNALMDNSGVYSDAAQGFYDNKVYALTESNGGLIDYAITYLQPSQKLSPGPKSDGKGGFVLFENGTTAYNLMDAGNLIWGASMREMGLDYSTIQLSSQLFAKYTTGNWDSPADQKAIREGYFFQKTTNNRVMYEVFKQLPNTIKSKYLK